MLESLVWNADPSFGGSYQDSTGPRVSFIPRPSQQCAHRIELACRSKG